MHISTCGLPPSACWAMIAFFFVVSMMVCFQQINSGVQSFQPLPLSARKAKMPLHRKWKHSNDLKVEEARQHEPKNKEENYRERNSKRKHDRKNNKRKPSKGKYLRHTKTKDYKHKNIGTKNKKENGTKSKKENGTKSKKENGIKSKTENGIKRRKENDIKSKKENDIKSKKEKGNEVTVTWENTQKKRIEHFREQCKSYNLQANTNKDNTVNVLYSSKYKLAYRLVPKVGSTFMIQVFSILSSFRKTKNIFDLSRQELHDGRANNFRAGMSLNRLKGYDVLIMARNPYSRLYSAYIDKVFILNAFFLCKDIISTLYGKYQQEKHCKYDISFEQFLKYYLVKGGESEKGHYGPIVSSKIGGKICNLKKIIIVKQETFSDDVEHAFKTLNVKGREYDTIYDTLHSKNTETSISSIVKTVYHKFSSYIQRGSCITWKSVAKKLWKSFQIQGYIRDRSEFPERKFRNADDYKSDEFLIKVIMQEVSTKPLKHDEKIQQRNKALLKAYSGIDKKYLNEIQDRYAMDFDLFQYGTKLKDAVS